jgi:hypothetical protein
MTNKILLIGAAFAFLSTNGYGATFSGTGDPINDAALSGGTMETFDAGPAGDSANEVFGNVTFVGVDGSFTVGSDYIGNYNTRGVYSVYNGDDYIPSNFRFDFATPVGAFGFNWGAADAPWLLSAYNANDVLINSYVLTATSGSNAGEYFGIAGPNIAYATLVNQAGGDYVFIDNFTYAGDAAPPTAAQVPTMSIYALALTALGLLLVAARRLRQSFKRS